MLHIALLVSIGKLQSSLMLSCPVFIVWNSANAKCLGSKGLWLLVYIYRDSTAFLIYWLLWSVWQMKTYWNHTRNNNFSVSSWTFASVGCCIIACYSAIPQFPQEKIISVLRPTSLGSFLMDYEKYICLTFTAQIFQRISQNKTASYSEYFITCEEWSWHEAPFPSADVGFSTFLVVVFSTFLVVV